MSLPLRAKTSGGGGEVDMDRSGETNVYVCSIILGLFSNARSGRGEAVMGKIEGGGGVEHSQLFVSFTNDATVNSGME
jgi:hypothetical protein